MGSSTPQLNVSQELLSLITGLAHYVKLLIRIGLKNSMIDLNSFLRDMSTDHLNKELDVYRNQMPALVNRHNYTCVECKNAVEDACFRRENTFPELWHDRCLRCSSCHFTGGFENLLPPDSEIKPLATCRFCGGNIGEDVHRIGRLNQYNRLLWIALARLMTTMDFDYSKLQELRIEELKKNQNALDTITISNAT